ncbi:MAG: YbbC/YhhH family protein [Pyrinomonadaceae bacterium]|nr:YbbC/YhhH family protein [Pyrinomonadaceae bacterium]
MKSFEVLIIFSLLFLIGCGNSEKKGVAQNITNLENSQSNQNNVSTNLETKFGYVPDEKTAIEIALKVWIPIYGKETIANEKPYHAILKNGVWTVSGSLPEDWDGGVASVQITQKDGKILKIIHGK